MSKSVRNSKKQHRNHAHRASPRRTAAPAHIKPRPGPTVRKRKRRQSRARRRQLLVLLIAAVLLALIAALAVLTAVLVTETRQTAPAERKSKKST